VFGSRWKVRSIRLVANASHDDFSLVSRFPRVSIFARWVFSLPALNETLGNAALRRLESYSTIGNENVVLRISHGDDLAVTFRYVGAQRLLDRYQIESFLTVPIRLCPAIDHSSSPWFMRDRSGEPFACRSSPRCISVTVTPTRVKPTTAIGE
jgi:hypothetical protein